MIGRLYPNFLGGRGAIALLLMRLVMGAAFIVHGWPKIQNPFGWMNSMGGSSIPAWLQGLAAFAEFGGGIALILGLLTAIAAFGLVCQMAAALLIVHLPNRDPFVASAPGQSSYELGLVYLIVAISLIVLGPGNLSVDAMLFGRRNTSP